MCGGQISVGIINDRSNTHTHSKSLQTHTLSHTLSHWLRSAYQSSLMILSGSKGVKCLEKQNKVFQALVKLLLTSVSNSDRCMNTS